MAYRIGIDVGPTRTSWATASRDGSEPELVEVGAVESVAGLLGGALVVGDEATGSDQVQELTRGFVGRLGESDAVMLGGTPYGVETLVGRLIASVISAASERLGSPPGAVVIVHDDSLDEFRVGLLTEAARVAGVPVADVVMVSRSEARSAAPTTTLPSGLEVVAGASALGWVRRPAPTAAATGGIGAAEVGIAATGAAATAGGAAAVAATGLGEGVATASAAMAPPAGVGPAGTPLSAPAGPTGAPMSPPAGPSGTPLSPPSGPTGTPLTPSAGPTGAPVSGPAGGPTGTPLPGPTGGPTGTPLEPVATPGSSGIPGVLKRPRKLPIIIGSVVAVVAVATVVVVATNNDDSPSTAPAATEPESGVTAGSGATVSTDAAVDTTSDTTASAVVPNAAECVQGEWTMRNDSFAEFFADTMAGAGAGSGEIVLTGVNGSVKIDVAPDGTWTITYDAWTLSASLAVDNAQMSIVIEGVDVSTGTFNDDGTYAFTGISVGTTVTSSATVNGVAVPLPQTDRSTQVIEGSGSFTCNGDEMELSVPASGGSFIMDRTG